MYVYAMLPWKHKRWFIRYICSCTCAGVMGMYSWMTSAPPHHVVQYIHVYMYMLCHGLYTGFHAEEEVGISKVYTIRQLLNHKIYTSGTFF